MLWVWRTDFAPSAESDSLSECGKNSDRPDFLGTHHLRIAIERSAIGGPA